MSVAAAVPFAINPKLDLAALSRRFEARRRLQIADFLEPESAERLRASLEQSGGWRHLLNSEERNYEFAAADWDALSDAERNKVAEAVDEAAAYGFQYQYDTIRVTDEGSAAGGGDGLLEAFAAFLSSPPALEAISQITRADDLVFADCQATRYRGGDFLTPHNDEVDGMHRRFAYVLGLTHHWMPRWGGLLHFVDAEGGVEETMTPRFNALCLFAVGQSHYVSQVASYAPVPRISVTGWLRTQRPG
jgi:Rps23 Pro-64 3,4-dihydroxylase Tpa1-like proline 4-hydroxylase